MERGLVQVDVCPAKPEQLALPHPGREPDHVQRLEPITRDGLQEPPRLLRREGDELVRFLERRRDQAGEVARGEAPAVRVLERVIQDPVELEHGCRRPARLDPPRVELREVRRLKLGEPQPADVRVNGEPEKLPVPLVRARGDGRLDHLIRRPAPRGDPSLFAGAGGSRGASQASAAVR